MEVSRDPQRFTSTRGVQLGQVDAGSRPLGVPPSIVEMDPPQRNRHRKPVILLYAALTLPEVFPPTLGHLREIAHRAPSPPD